MMHAALIDHTLGIGSLQHESENGLMTQVENVIRRAYGLPDVTPGEGLLLFCGIVDEMVCGNPWFHCVDYYVMKDYVERDVREWNHKLFLKGRPFDVP